MLLGISGKTILSNIIYGVVFMMLMGCAYILKLYFLRFKSIKDFPVKGDYSFHFTKPSKQYYRQVLDPRVMYARQANAIDERRADFKRVKWKVYDTLPNGQRARLNGFDKFGLRAIIQILGGAIRKTSHGSLTFPYLGW